MRKWTVIVALALCLALLCTTFGAQAQDYSFSLDRNISHVIVNADGSADIEYWLTYTCDQGAHEIDIVDIGMPNSSYDLGTAQAWYSAGAGGGEEYPLSDIRQSEWLSTGIEVHLKQYTIQPGQQGTLHVRINVQEMVYPDEDENYASVEFAPHYYDSQSVHGKSFQEIDFYFPPGVTSEETRYHGQEYDEVDLVDDRIVFIYTYPDGRGDQTHLHGISFPRTYVNQVYKAPIAVGSTGTGSSSTGSNVSGALGSLVCVGGFMLVFVGGTALSVVQSKKRKMAYLPPALSVEGVGIKRGLTAVEAAILLEMPLNRILTMIMFGLLKKKAVAVESEDPLRLEAVTPKPQVKYRDYEDQFLESLQADGTLDEKKLQQVIVDLIKAVNKKLKGFSRKETVAYYKSIVDRAWDQVGAEQAPEIKSKYFNQGLEWMMMDEKFEERTTKTFESGPVYMPPWWAYYRPWVPQVRTSRASSGSSRPSTSTSGGGRQITLPTLPGAAFAGTMVSGMERTAGGIVSKLESFTGGVTQKTNPPPVSSSSRSHSGGCACACACAGCACACAGGGR